MTIRVALHHKTAYHYDKPIQLAPHVFRLRPAAHSRTPVTAYSLKITPENHFISWQQDPFGNYLARVVFPEKSTELSIEVDLIAEMTVINPFDFFLEEYAENFPFVYPEQLLKELAPYLEIRENGPVLASWLSEVETGQKAIVDFLVYLNQRVNQTVNYSIRMEAGVQTCEETLEKQLGSCRDSAWLLVQALRHMGLAARFVSGYLVQLTADIKSLDGPSGTDVDFTDLHAWAEVYIPGAGWIGLDPTSGLLAGEGHIPLACTADYVSAAPVTGGYTGQANIEFSFSNNVTRIHEDPRVTKPYSEEQWTQIDKLGHKVDAELKSGDVRLTMGGEPTFISIDNMDAPEWNIDADGVQKRKLAGELVRRLRDSFAPGG
ncbi:transglutaminase family protein, partial [Methylotenera sp.]